MKRPLGFAVLLWLSLTMSTASADPILWVCDHEGKIGKVDVATGKVTLVGDAGVVLTDIAFDTEGNLFGVSFDTFYRIDMATGAATAIGSLGPAGINALVFSTTGIAYAMGNGGDDLYKINKKTGAATSIGRVRHGGSLGDLAFHDGRLYLATSTGRLVRVKLSPVGGTSVGPFGVAGVFGLAHGDDGVLYAVAGTSVYSVEPGDGHGHLRCRVRRPGTGRCLRRGLRQRGFTLLPSEPAGGEKGVIAPGRIARRRRGTHNGRIGQTRGRGGGVGPWDCTPTGASGRSGMRPTQM